MSKLPFFTDSGNEYIESLYQNYLKDPGSVELSWRQFFQGFDLATTTGRAGEQAQMAGPLDLKAYRMIESFRERGHLESKTNPIRPRKDRKAKLQLADLGISPADLEQDVPFVQGILPGLKSTKLKDVYEYLQKTYLGPIGVEYGHIRDLEVRDWVRDAFERGMQTTQPTIEEKKRILEKLNEATVFENFLHAKFIGQKRFSLEGGENLIPGLDTIFGYSAEAGVKDVVIGMAHRGRLSVLTNLLHKTYDYIFSEFEGNQLLDSTMGDGDVKYHLGHKTGHTTVQGKKINLQLLPNPSHLEAVNPVVAGYARALSDEVFKGDRSTVLPILIHGDAAVAGQGIGHELSQQSKLKGYFVGGTIHFVVNNQVGFTTDFHDARSSDYCTAIAKISDSPVFHVNGDDAEAVWLACTLAAQFRAKFQQDVFIDMVCYRKWGHNEGDEPKFTQPNLYKLIAGHSGPREIYLETLLSQGKIEASLASKLQTDFKNMLQDRLNMVKENKSHYVFYSGDQDHWGKIRRSRPEDFNVSPDTAVEKKVLEEVQRTLTTIPSDLRPVDKAMKLIEDKKKMWADDKLDWAQGELFAYGTLLLEGHNVRMSGQDVIRGTFSHRHAGLIDESESKIYFPLNHIRPGKQGELRIYNSLLSEYSVLGFEYGYALAHPQNLVIWEAQFGDFANGAQTIIDQFIASAESKWQVQNGMILLLPHGYEGQGPEHSNARPERFLQLCAEFNMVVANITTPANYFHLLRRQLKWPFRKPLIVMSPKSQLRHPDCVSSTKDFISGRFQEVIDDASIKDPKAVKRVLLTTGKVFFDLLAKQKADNRQDVAIVRLEQIHPINHQLLTPILEKYKNASLTWVQDEPKNMGYWNYILRKLAQLSPDVVSRKSSASPSTGYLKAHLVEQKDLVERAFNLNLERIKF